MYINGTSCNGDCVFQLSQDARNTLSQAVAFQMSNSQVEIRDRLTEEGDVSDGILPFN